MNAHANLLLEYTLFNALAEADSYISSLDEKKSSVDKDRVDVNLIHHLSAYLTDQIQKLSVRDALDLYSLLHSDITLEIPPSLHSSDRLVLLQLYLINRVEHELALRYA